MTELSHQEGEFDSNKRHWYEETQLIKYRL